MSDQNALYCQHCGAEPGEENPYEPGGPILIAVDWEPLDEIGFDRHQRVICSLCREGERTLAADRPSAESLLIKVRRATLADQLKVFQWLTTKFPHS